MARPNIPFLFSCAKGKAPYGTGASVPNPGVGGAGDLLLGYNMDYLGEPMRISPWLNFWENSRPWGDGLGTDLSTLTLDSQGYVRAVTGGTAATIVMTNDNPAWVGHRMVLTWSGAGSCNIDGTNKTYPGGNRIEFDGIAGNVALFSTPAGSSTGQYPTNIKIFRLDRESLINAGQRWNPDTIAYLTPFKSLRFMDWGVTNSNPGGVWANRTVDSQCFKMKTFIDTNNPVAGYSNSGYALETMIDLCNQFHKSPHFHIGHLATDEYATQFATIVRNTLDPTLIATFEFSNEIWNFGFPQAAYFNGIGSTEWPGEGSAWIEAGGRRGRQVMSLVKSVYAATGALSRVKCIQNVQTGWLWLADRQLSCPLVVAGGQPACYTDIDRVGLTFYISAGLQYAVNWPLIQSWIATGAEYAFTRAFEQLRYGTIPGLRNRENDDDITVSNATSFVNICNEVSAQVSQAASYGLEAVYYEWDTHFDDAANPDHTAWLVALCRRPEMKQLFKDILTFSAGAGIKIANVWGSTEGDTQWAIAASMSDTSHAKYSAIAEWVVENS